MPFHCSCLCSRISKVQFSLWYLEFDIASNLFITESENLINLKKLLDSFLNNLNNTAASFVLGRYEVCICSGKKVETVASGVLEQLLLHSPSVQNLHSKRLNASFKIHLPNVNSGAVWFTKSILTRFTSSFTFIYFPWITLIVLSYNCTIFIRCRFLRIVDSPDILDISKNFEKEICQLEETRQFQLSMNVRLIFISPIFLCCFTFVKGK